MDGSNIGIKLSMLVRPGLRRLSCATKHNHGTSNPCNAPQPKQASLNRCANLYLLDAICQPQPCTLQVTSPVTSPVMANSRNRISLRAVWEIAPGDDGKGRL